MASWGRIAFRAVRTLSGTPLPMQKVTEAASQTFKLGAALTYVNGHAQECGTNPALIFGIATKDGQNGTIGAKTQPVVLAHPDVLFLGTFDTGASEGSGVTALRNRGCSYGVTKHTSTGKWYVDYNKTGANSRVVVWDFWDQGGMALGDTLAQVVFAFDPAYFQGHKTS